MNETADTEHGWEHIPPELAAVARRCGVSAAELDAFRDDPANQDTGEPDFDEQEWSRILAPWPDRGAHSRVGDDTIRTGCEFVRPHIPAPEPVVEPDADDRRRALVRLDALRLRLGALRRHSTATHETEHPAAERQPDVVVDASASMPSGDAESDDDVCSRDSDVRDDQGIGRHGPGPSRKAGRPRVRSFPRSAAGSARRPTTPHPASAPARAPPARQRSRASVGPCRPTRASRPGDVNGDDARTSVAVPSDSADVVGRGHPGEVTPVEMTGSR